MTQISDGRLFGLATKLENSNLNLLVEKLRLSQLWNNYDEQDGLSDQVLRQKLFHMLLTWRKRTPDHLQIQELKKALEDAQLKSFAKAYFPSLNPEKDEIIPPPCECEECEGYFKNDHGLRTHHGKSDCGSSESRVDTDYRRITLKGERIEVKIPLGDQHSNKKIKVHTLQARPHYLNLQDSEVVIGVGLRISPRGLKFKKNVIITMPHCATFRDLEENPAERNATKVFLYCVDINDGSRIVKPLPSSEGPSPRSDLRERDLDVYMKNLDGHRDFWIISNTDCLTKKRLMCTLYTPVHLINDNRDCIEIRLRDNSGMEQDSKPGWRKRHSCQLDVAVGQGDLTITCFIGGKPILQEETITERRIKHLTQHNVIFRPRRQDVNFDQVLLKFTLGGIFMRFMSVPVAEE